MNQRYLQEFLSYSDCAKLFKFDFQDYIHHFGRTAPGDKGKGTVLLFFMPKQLEFLISLRVINSAPR